MELTTLQEGILKAAINKWGENAQIDMCIEECSELIQALCKYKRDKTGERVGNINEEIADVFIMINQMALIFNYSFGFSVQSYINSKITRLEERINS